MENVGQVLKPYESRLAAVTRIIEIEEANDLTEGYAYALCHGMRKRVRTLRLSLCRADDPWRMVKRIW